MAKKVGGKAKEVTMPDYNVSNTYRKTCSIKGCGRKAKWAFVRKGKHRGACSRKHLRMIP
jgi:hypothetical protein